MFNKIMVPIDLEHVERQKRALECAADLAKRHNLPIVFVGVTASGPTRLAPNPETFHQKLKAFAEIQASEHGLASEAHTSATNDPTTEVDDALLRAIDETGSDLVVMATHIPGLFEYLWPSNGGKIAGHAKCSVMLVRP